MTRFYGQWVQVDGEVEIVSQPEAMELLVDYYRRLSGEHPDWDDYRDANATRATLHHAHLRRRAPART